jgi:hypothetical protein
MSATSIVLTGPTPTDYLGAVAGQVGVATGNFTVTPDDVFTGVVGLSDLSVLNGSAAGGTFNPPSLTFNNSSTPQTFTYTPAKVGKQHININPISVIPVTKNYGLQVITTH